MKLPEKEKAAQRAAFRKMSPAEKIDHIYTYYKWPIFLALALLILLGCGLFLGLDGYILYHLRLSSGGTMGVIWTLALAVVIAAAIVLVIVLEHVFPLLASVENTSKAMLKNAFLIGTHYLFASILVFAVHFAMFFVVVAWFTPLIIFGEGLCALISAWLLNGILISVSGTPEDGAEPEALPEASNEGSKEEETP